MLAKILFIALIYAFGVVSGLLMALCAWCLSMNTDEMDDEEYIKEQYR